MASKHGTGEPSWRPLAQKLSSLIARRNSGKSQNFPDATDKRGSVFSFKRQSKVPEKSDLEFKPIAFDLDALEPLRLPDGWLGARAESTNYDQARQPPADTSNASTSATPIADLFASRLVSRKPISSDKPHLAYPRQHGNDDTKRPFSMVETMAAKSKRHSLASTDAAQVMAEVQSINSVLDRGRPVEPRHVVTDVSRATRPLREALPLESGALAIRKDEIIAAPEPSKVPQPAISTLTTLRSKVSSQRLPGENRNVVALKRHSMFEGGARESRPATVKTSGIAVASRSVSATPTDRTQAWQKHNISGLNSPASSVSPSFDSGVPSQPAPPIRRQSTRGRVAGDRLSWIKDLEEKKGSGVNRDLVVLKKQAGSVSDKLAMFENKKALAAPRARPPPLARSNSTSRFSGTGFESIFSTDSNTATASPRSSIDTVRTNIRGSSVMSYYDDSFREKLESLVGGQEPDKDESYPPEKQRVNAQFVPAEPGKPVESSTCLTEEGAENASGE